ncbi:MAG: helix-turn-helix domain-containing protein [Duncaniella sp.]|uniref:helix-turn-helix domain-containing protein n=1 Tax=Duncaniella sp. TaxID=2518496 RepID=UPI0023D0C25C|nr:helix-turn-helix domain-containing protein [Duncaniella sp.]MDE5988119.1 helix-turn-helix domain-containing protein [Duncaniella sp.]MDE6175566.1 helix-turn-helix domain-containing protein [Duncaniella sp.]
MEKKIINLDSIDDYNKLYGLPTLHPLVTVIDLKQASQAVNHIRVKYGVYALFLKNGVECSIRYGRRHYDYQEGTVVSFSPGQMIDVEMKRDVVAPDVVGLLFHPDLIYGTPLGDKISDFSFFDYSQMEALHLSEDERGIFLDCLDKIRRELEHPVDHHSAALLSANIQLLLEYLHRFYDRQFIVRHKVNSDIVSRFERELKAYFERDSRADTVPSVAYFAEKVNLTPGYFGDLVKKETGNTAQEMISRQVVAVAKHRLATSADDISIIAYDLGFQYPQHFTRLFKRLTGQSPRQYREHLSLN